VSLDGAAFSRAPHVVDARVGDVLVLLDPDTDRYARLNATAALIWEQLERPSELPALADALASRYGIAGDVARRQVEELLTSLLDRGVVVQDEHAAG
jgi:hypothetical protein